MRDKFLAPIVFKRNPAAEPEVFEQASPLLRVTADAPDFFVITAPATPSSTPARPGCSSRRCAQSRSGR